MPADDSEITIHVEQLSKSYRLQTGEQATRVVEWLDHRVQSALRRVGLGRLGLSRPAMPLRAQWLHALRDINFSVRQGEVVGIIGRNGAGKSTLLKILARIVRPSHGRVGVRGRIGTLLEVGSGFHPELTGRENIFLNGAILGMSWSEVRRKFDEIVAFSEMEAFLDMPVKRYSSGMYTRLAFAVAAHLDPDILIADEVLAVGDAAFQRRCIGKMSALGQTGRTVLFVSHNLQSIRSLCQRAILLQDGQLVADGRTDDVIGAYLHRSEGDVGRGGEFVVPPERQNVGKSVEIIRGRVDMQPERDCRVVMEYRVRQPLHAAVWVSVLTEDSQVVFDSRDVDMSPDLFQKQPGVFRAEVTLPTHVLAGGSYLLTLGASDFGERVYDLQSQVLRLQVSSPPAILHPAARLGPVAIPAPWRVELLETAQAAIPEISAAFDDASAK